MLDHRKSKGFPKTIYFCFMTMQKPFTVWITTNCGIFLMRWKYQTTLPASWETCMAVKKQQLELMEKWAGSKLGNQYIKTRCHPAYLANMQSTSCEMPAWMKHKLESRLLGEISTTSDIQWRRQWHPTPALLPGKCHGWKSLVGRSPWGH